MKVMIPIAVAVAVMGVTARIALADHHGGMVMPADDEHEASSFDVGVSLLAARFDSMYYAGDYQGVVPTVGWARGRFALSGAIAVYRLEENGLSLYGQGDAVAQGSARIADTERCHLFVNAAVSLPTANDSQGLGMGHTMAMPSTTTACSAGKSR